MSTVRGLPDRLSMAIEQSKKTPAQVVAEVSISRSTLFAYLRGEKCPSAIVLARLSKCLSVSSDWLLGISNKK